MKEERLITKARKGNTRAFEKLMLTHQDTLYKTAYLYLRNKEDALDAVQETAYKAFMNIGKLKEPKYFLTWLTRILIHSIFAMNKKKGEMVPFEKHHDTGTDQANIEEHMDLRNAIDSLDEHVQLTIQLYYFQDYSISMIAEQTGMAEGTIKTHLHRARKALKQELEKEVQNKWTNTK
ncbi:sigma-70 family RNA polymerase sigma factor [Bacillus vallismortis]|uniref:sigma-70 family RNA polymerase sigma factor n=1 Tax=Bacillus vallismortis TaxID=72361 RepID=UPI0002898CD2|nr:sigma-70 family RNA polymerase sigma factor [Bacillus vallismortis]MBG9768363.1 RNA polymerase [Bacillus vallismortis]MCY8424171.1 sigma-70 family RNA polymerase sigma factor [Bacillus vallismortis]MEC1269288.1 sigma-70 family RNA polymerase sigma factor [Bacillus vallismortis]QAV09820.1 RNA polymerase [Bacillus vallismortis]